MFFNRFDGDPGSAENGSKYFSSASEKVFCQVSFMIVSSMETTAFHNLNEIQNPWICKVDTKKSAMPKFFCIMVWMQRFDISF